MEQIFTMFKWVLFLLTINFLGLLAIGLYLFKCYVYYWFDLEKFLDQRDRTIIKNLKKTNAVSISDRPTGPRKVTL